jgi:hypothetical protein
VDEGRQSVRKSIFIGVIAVGEARSHIGVIAVGEARSLIRVIAVGEAHNLIGVIAVGEAHNLREDRVFRHLFLLQSSK